MLLLGISLLVLFLITGGKCEEWTQEGITLDVSFSSLNAKEANEIKIVEKNQTHESLSLRWKWEEDSHIYRSVKHVSEDDSEDVYYTISTYNFGEPGSYTGYLYVDNVLKDPMVKDIDIKEAVTVGYAIGMGIFFLIIYAGTIILLVLRNKLPCIINQKKRLTEFTSNATDEMDQESQSSSMDSRHSKSTSSN